MKKIILATTSPYRIEAFKMLGFPFESAASNVEENFSGRPASPIELVKELAKRKARSVADKYKDGLIIGFDSVGWFGENILEKPKNREEAHERLVMMSGKNFQFYTGVCFLDAESGNMQEVVSGTDCLLRNLRILEIEKYLDEDPNFKTYALGFDPLGHSSVGFIKKIDGSYNNLLRGIPLELIAEALGKLDLSEGV